MGQLPPGMEAELEKFPHPRNSAVLVLGVPRIYGAPNVLDNWNHSVHHHPFDSDQRNFGGDPILCLLGADGFISAEQCHHAAQLSDFWSVPFSKLPNQRIDANCMGRAPILWSPVVDSADPDSGVLPDSLLVHENSLPPSEPGFQN